MINYLHLQEETFKAGERGSYPPFSSIPNMSLTNSNSNILPFKLEEIPFPLHLLPSPHSSFPLLQLSKQSHKLNNHAEIKAPGYSNQVRKCNFTCRRLIRCSKESFMVLEKASF